jgi:hypothetical protein
MDKNTYDQNKKFLVTGDRDWKDVECIRHALTIMRDKGYSILVEGECHKGGADIIARNIWKEEFNLEVRGYEVTKQEWRMFGKAAGVLRNQKMLDKEHPDEDGIKIEFVLAFHGNIDKSTGTKDMLKRVKKAKIPNALITSYFDVWYI